jgi:hypothetical protein
MVGVVPVREVTAVVLGWHYGRDPQLPGLGSETPRWSAPIPTTLVSEVAYHEPVELLPDLWMSITAQL